MSAIMDTAFEAWRAEVDRRLDVLEAHKADERLADLEAQSGELDRRLAALETLTRDIREDGRETLRLLRKMADLDDPKPTPRER